MFSWAVNDDVGRGLFRLPRDWNQRRQEYLTHCEEIREAGYEIDRHDEFNVRLEGATFYTLRKTRKAPV